MLQCCDGESDLLLVFMEVLAPRVVTASSRSARRRRGPQRSKCSSWELQATKRNRCELGWAGGMAGEKDGERGCPPCPSTGAKATARAGASDFILNPRHLTWFMFHAMHPVDFSEQQCSLSARHPRKKRKGECMCCQQA